MFVIETPEQQLHYLIGRLTADNVILQAQVQKLRAELQEKSGEGQSNQTPDGRDGCAPEHD